MKTHCAKNHEKTLSESGPLVIHQQYAVKGKIGKVSFNKFPFFSLYFLYFRNDGEFIHDNQLTPPPVW